MKYGFEFSYGNYEDDYCGEDTLFLCEVDERNGKMAHDLLKRKTGKDGSTEKLLKDYGLNDGSAICAFLRENGIEYDITGTIRI